MIHANPGRVALAFALATAAFAAAAQPEAAAARRPHPEKPPFPALVLPQERAQGGRAIELLGARLPEVAAWYGKSADEFRAALLHDRRLRLDRRARLYVEDELEGPLPAEPAPAPNGIVDGTLLPPDQTFVLHSRPGAPRKLYLNFRGATLTGTAWNRTASTITALPFDLDGIPYSFNTAELQRIQAIWQRVAEDYAPFDVDVTTEAPPPDALRRSSGADQAFGTTVLVTKSAGVYGCSCGGVAYIGAFDDTSEYYKPALVFYDQLGGGNEKYVAEAVSHEAGHNLGLLHDGSASSGYYGGHGGGTTAWAPIMGAGYYRNVTQWSRGEYAGANNVQDDLVVMQGTGAPLRADDHGNTVAAATVLAAAASGGISTYTAQGVVERASDVDVFSFTAGAGSVTVGVPGAARGPNLDVLLQLHDAAGRVLATVNPAEALAASTTITLPAAGVYYASVQGTAKGDPRTNGYSKYGSLGHYGVTITALTPGGQPPVAVVGATPTNGTAPLTVAFNAAGSTDRDGTIVAYEWTFGDGARAAGPTATHTYASAGTFTAQLSVTDNLGYSATRSVTITANPAVAPAPLHVASIAMSRTLTAKSASATARVRVVDAAGRAVAGATVSGSWSGLVAGSGSAVSDGDGVATFVSPATAARAGTFVFTVGGVALAGYGYDAAANGETSDAIAR